MCWILQLHVDNSSFTKYCWQNQTHVRFIALYNNTNLLSWVRILLKLCHKLLDFLPRNSNGILLLQILFPSHFSTGGVPCSLLQNHSIDWFIFTSFCVYLLKLTVSWYFSVRSICFITVHVFSSKILQLLSSLSKFFNYLWVCWLSQDTLFRLTFSYRHLACWRKEVRRCQ